MARSPAAVLALLYSFSHRRAGHVCKKRSAPRACANVDVTSQAVALRGGRARAWHGGRTALDKQLFIYRGRTQVVLQQYDAVAPQQRAHGTCSKSTPVLNIHRLNVLVPFKKYTLAPEHTMGEDLLLLLTGQG